MDQLCDPDLTKAPSTNKSHGLRTAIQPVLSWTEWETIIKRSISGKHSRLTIVED